MHVLEAAPAAQLCHRASCIKQQRVVKKVNNIINYTFPVLGLSVHLVHLIDHVCPSLLIFPLSPPPDDHTMCRAYL